MKQYMISVFDDPENQVAPDSPEMAKIYADVDALNEQIKAADAWVFGGGLHPPTTATVLKPTSGTGTDGDVVTTDGPYTETKEYLGGFWVIQAPDLDAALEWGRKAAAACAGPVEVRPFAEDVG